MKRRVTGNRVSPDGVAVEVPRRARNPRGLIVVVQLMVALFVGAPSVTAQEADRAQGAPPPGVSAAELEVLRQLLGVPASAPAPAPPPPTPVEAPPVVDLPTVQPVVQPSAEPPVAEPAVQEKPAAVKKAPAKPAPKPKPAPVKKPVAKPAPKAKPAAKPAPKPVEDREAVPAVAPAPVEETPPAIEASAAPEPAPVPLEEIPPAGTVVSIKNMERYKHLLGPSIQWSVARGATLDVIDPRPIPMEPFRAEATQRYSAQVKLAADKRSIQNYVSGIPFPFVNDEDPDAAVKMMFNMESRVNYDDLDIRNFTCDTGELDVSAGFQLQRHYLTEHFRRLFYVGRAFVEPKPIWKTQEGVRYREMLYPLREPFDLKGAGFTYIRHLDPNRQDDSWLYFPQIKRLRRLSTAQRSEGVFGQDIDLDSYGGYSGNPAWMKWTLLGKKTILASMHADKHMPAKMQPAPANFFPDGQWEAREVYIILGVSQLGGYNFGRRVIYLDKESWVIPYTEIYDLKGGLWRSLIHTWNVANKPRPEAVRSVYDYEPLYIPAMTLVDMQLEHATYCQLPGPDVPAEEGWYYNFGPAEGVTEEVFSVSNMIGGGR